MTKNADLFNKLGLEVVNSEVEVGQTYPLYGMVTEILNFNEETKVLRVVLNFNVQLDMYLLTDDKVELIKKRSFEPGIFLSKVTKKNKESESKYAFEAECTTAIFGKQQNNLEI